MQTVLTARFPEQSPTQESRQDGRRKQVVTPNAHDPKGGYPGATVSRVGSACKKNDYSPPNDNSSHARTHFLITEARVRAHSLKLDLNTVARSQILPTSTPFFAPRTRPNALWPAENSKPRSANGIPYVMRVPGTFWNQKGILGIDIHRARCNRVICHIPCYEK